MLLFLLSLFPARAQSCEDWGAATATVTLEGVAESSGLAHGSTGVLYTLEDGGNDALLHVFDMTDGWRGTQLVRGATNTDWEDLAAGPCPATVDAAECLWIADTGDNDGARDELVLWVLPATTSGAEDAVRCSLRLPDARRDVEALLIAPDGAVRLVSKESDEAHVYLLASPTCDGTTEALAEEVRIAVDAPITGGVASPDGDYVLLRNAYAAWRWPACGGTPDWSAPPAPVDLASQQQGEAIALDAAHTLYTTSEGAPFAAVAAACTEEGPLDACAACGCGTQAPRAVPPALLALAALALVRRTRTRSR